MTPLDPAELSAYVDGELPAERMREIERIVGSDPALRAELESLTKLHAELQAAGRTAGFRPAVNLRAIDGINESRRTISSGVIAFVALLVVAQLVLRLFDALAVAFALECIALLVVLTGVGFLATRTAG